MVHEEQNDTYILSADDSEPELVFHDDFETPPVQSTYNDDTLVYHDAHADKADDASTIVHQDTVYTVSDSDETVGADTDKVTPTVDSSSGVNGVNSGDPVSKPAKKGSDKKSLGIAIGIAVVGAVGYLYVYPMIEGGSKPAPVNKTAPIQLAVHPSEPVKNVPPLLAVPNKPTAPTVSTTTASPAVLTISSAPVVSSTISQSALSMPSASDATSANPASTTQSTLMDTTAKTLSSSAKSHVSASLPVVTLSGAPTSSTGSTGKAATAVTPSTPKEAVSPFVSKSVSPLTLSASSITALEGGLKITQSDYQELNKKVNKLSQEIDRLEGTKRAPSDHVVEHKPVYTPPVYRPVYHAPVYYAPPARVVPKKVILHGGVGNGMALISKDGRTVMLGLGSYYTGLGTITAIKQNGEIIGTKGKGYIR